MAAHGSALVGYGVSSESDSEGEETTKQLSRHTASTTTQSRNFLVEAGDLSSDLSSEDEDHAPECDVQSSPPRRFEWSPASTNTAKSQGEASQKKLPTPKLDIGMMKKGGSSVFKNPFQEERNEQLSLLQKHVQLTLEAKPTEIGGKKICLLYRKEGRCRYGSKCKFAHDSDLQTAVPSSVSSSRCETVLASSSSFKVDDNNDLEEETRTKKRKPGLSDSLIPSKRVLKHYKAQVTKDKPWVN